MMNRSIKKYLLLSVASALPLLYSSNVQAVKYAKETVGLATCIPQKFVKSEVKDKDNFLYTLSAPGSDRFHHYTMFTSCKETFGYPTPEAWFAYMREWKEELQHPVQIKIKN